MKQSLFSNTQFGYIYAMLSAIFYGCSGLFIKMAYGTGLSAIQLLILQNLIAVPTMWIIAAVKYKRSIIISKQQLFRLFVLGSVFSSSVTFCYYQAFEYLDISIATILLYTYPILIAIYTFLFEKEKPNWVISLSLAFVFMGCFLILDVLHADMSMPFIGILYGFGSALAYAGLNIYVEKKIINELPSFLLVTYSSTFALMIFMLYEPPTFVFKGNIGLYHIGIAALLAYITQVPPMALLYKALQLIGAVKTSIVSNIEIPTAALLGYFFYQETLTISQLSGMLLVVGGILVMKNSEFLLQTIATTQSFRPKKEGQ
ncbi:MAG: DMT family transporter [Bacillota bacterium]